MLIMVMMALGLVFNVFADSTDWVQPFQMKDGRKVWGIMIRQNQVAITLAMANGIEEIRRREIMIPGSMTREASSIDQLLSLIEKAIDNNESGRINHMLASLTAAIADFEKAANPFLDPKAANPNQRVECLQNAIRYYRNNEKLIPDNVTALTIIGNINDLDLLFRTNRKRFFLNHLGELIAAHADLDKLIGLTNKVSRDKADALTLQKALYKKAIADFRDDAMKAFAARFDGDKTLKLLAVIKNGEVLGQEYVADLKAILKDSLAVIKEVKVDLPTKVDALFTLGGNLELDQRNYSKVVIDARSCIDFLNKVRDLVFGEQKEVIKKTIDTEITALNQIIDASSSRKNLIQELRSDFNQAEVLFEKDQFKEAFELYGKIDNAIVSEHLPVSDIAAKIKDRLSKSQGWDILSRMKSPVGLDGVQLDNLMLQAQQFYDLNQKQFETLGLSPDLYVKEINNLSNYRKYYLRLKDLQDIPPSQAVLKFDRLNFMSQWLQSIRNEITPQALRNWQQFVAENADTLVMNAYQFLIDKPLDFSAELLKSFTSLVQYCLERNDFTKAETLINHSFNALDEGSNPAVVKALVQLKIQVGDAYVAANDLPAAFALYQDVEDRFHALALELDVSNKLAQQLKRMGDVAASENQSGTALDLYEKLAQKYRDFALHEKIIDKIVEYRLLNARQTSENPDIDLQLFNTLSKVYPDAIAKVYMVKQRSDKIVNDLESLWVAGSYLEVMNTIVTYMANYPQFANETSLMSHLIRKISARVYRQLQDYKENLVSGKPYKPLSTSLITAVSDMVVRYPVYANANKLDLLLVDAKLIMANEYIKSGQIVRGFDIYAEILNLNPDIASEKKLPEIMESLQWKYRVEKFLKPFGISTLRDWVAFALTVVLWPLFLLRSIGMGRKRGHLTYRLVHFATIFGVFVILMACFVYGKYPYFKAFIFAFILPQVLFQSLGFSTYLCFPLIYCYRIIAIERFLANLVFILNGHNRDRGPFKKIIQLLDQEIAQREMDLPLLHDRTLYKIQLAINLSAAKPEKGYQKFLHLLKRLNQELVKTENWKKHYATCIYNLGAIAYHLERKEEALKYLLEHLDYDIKHVDTHFLLGELHFERHEWAESIPHLKICLAAHGRDDQLWYKLGRSFFETMNYVAAYKCFAAINRRDREILFYGARSYARANQVDKATEWYQEMIKQNSNDSEALYSMASTLAYFHDDKKAVKIVSFLKEDDPYYARGQVIVGNILFRAGRIKEAMEMFTRALHVDKQCVQALVSCGQIALEANQTDQARAFFLEALKIDVDNAPANYFIGNLIEGENHQQAIYHHKKATNAKEIRRLAEKKLGVLYFQDQDWDNAMIHFGNAEAEGEKNPWVLFLLAHTLATRNQSAKCEPILSKIMEGNHSENEWLKRSANAMYTIGVRLFESQAYKMAYECFEYVKVNLRGINQTIVKLLDEAKFRMVIQLMGDNNYHDANQVLVELKTQKTNVQTFDIKQANRYQYYTALCLLYSRNYQDATKILNGLNQTDATNLRYQYHLIIAELGAGKIQQAAKRMLELREKEGLPIHIQIGIKTINAYLQSTQKNFRHADAALGLLPELNQTFPGIEDVKSTVYMARITYLCQLKDLRKISDIVDLVPANQRDKATYLYSLAAAASGQLKLARDIIQPISEHEESYHRFFMILTTELALKGVAGKNYGLAKSLFEEIPNRPESIEGVCLLLSMAEILTNLEDYTQLTNAIVTLTGFQERLQDKSLRHILIHNLAILYLKRAIFAEELRMKEKAQDIWDACWQFWDEQVLFNEEYWNLEQNRLSASGIMVNPFTTKEIEAISKKFIEDNLAPMFISYILRFLDLEDEAGVLRHLNLLKITSEKSGYTKVNFMELKNRFDQLVKSFDKTAPRMSTWNFNIMILEIQYQIGTVIEVENHEETEQKLANFRLCRTQFATPKDYRDAQKSYNTIIYDALHLGLNGKFNDAGNKFDEVLKNLIPGIIMEEVEAELRAIREKCHNYIELTAKGIDLKEEFAKTYEVVKGKKNLFPEVKTLDTQH